MKSRKQRQRQSRKAGRRQDIHLRTAPPTTPRMRAAKSGPARTSMAATLDAAVIVPAAIPLLSVEDRAINAISVPPPCAGSTGHLSIVTATAPLRRKAQGPASPASPPRPDPTPASAEPAANRRQDAEPPAGPVTTGLSEAEAMLLAEMAQTAPLAPAPLTPAPLAPAPAAPPRPGATPAPLPADMPPPWHTAPAAAPLPRNRAPVLHRTGWLARIGRSIGLPVARSPRIRVGDEVRQLRAEIAALKDAMDVLLTRTARD